MNEKNHELKKIVIIGAGGQGKDVLWTIMDINKISSRFDIIGFLDDDKKLHGKTINRVPVLGGMNWLSNKNKMGCIIAVGDGKIRENQNHEKQENRSFLNCFGVLWGLAAWGTHF